MVNQEELNKKLAEWARFWHDKGGDSLSDIHVRPRWCSPSPRYRKLEPPNFTQSLDTCFKWLVPKLEGNIWLINADYSWEFSIMSRGKQFIGKAETPALALCKAVEKLIDKEAE